MSTPSVPGPAQTTSSWNAGRVAAIAIGAVVAVNVALASADRIAGGSRPGPPSSSFTTDGSGLAAYADLLARRGHGVTQLREPLAESTLDPSATVVVLDAPLSPEDIQTLSAFVASGGRLVAGGIASNWIGQLLTKPPRWTPAPAGSARPVAPVPEVAGVNTAVSSGPGVWADTGQAVPALVGPRGALLAVSSVGSGRVVLLASGAPLQNRLLDDVDNAALGLAIAGEQGRPVIFAEHPHGFGAGIGIRAIPARARWAIAGVALAALLWMLGRGRRLGPPEQPSRSLPPPRRTYVEAVATTLAKTKRRPEAIAPVHIAARDRIARLTGVEPDADAQAWRAAVERLGITQTEADALLRPPTDDRSVVEVGRAFAKTGRRTQ